MNHWVAMSSFYLKKDAADVVSWAGENGFNGVEIWADVPFLYVDDTTEEALNKIVQAGSGMKFSIHSPIYGINISCANPGIRRESLRQVEKAVRWAEKTRADRFVFHAGCAPSGRTDIKRIIRGYLDESISRIKKECFKNGVELLIENVGLSDKDLDCDINNFIDIMDTHGLRCCLDTGHANVAWDPGKTGRMLRGRAGQIHVSDNNGKEDQHMAAGEGNISWNHFKEMLADGDMPIVHEVQGKDSVSSVLRSRRYLENCFT